MRFKGVEALPWERWRSQGKSPPGQYYFQLALSNCAAIHIPRKIEYIIATGIPRARKMKSGISILYLID